MSIRQIGEFDVLLWLHTAANPPSAEWNHGLEQIGRLKEQRGGDLTYLRSLVVSDGGAPVAHQRGELFTNILEGQRHKVAAITMSMANPVLRGIGTALSWLNQGFKLFGPMQAMQALHHVDLSGHADLVMAGLDQLQLQLPFNETLAVVKKALTATYTGAS